MAWNSEYLRNRHGERRILAIEYLGGVCNRCGSLEKEDDPFEFDHIKPFCREACIGDVLGRWSVERLRGELDKCQLLHKSCHIDKSREGKEHGGGHNKILNPDHGTWAMYRRDGCRCKECKTWRRLYDAKVVDARGNQRDVYPPSDTR